IAVNQTLTHKYGYCVYFDNSDDPRIPSWSAQSCGKHHTYSQGLSYTDSFFELEKKQGKKAMKHALLYRPELPHKLKVLRKKDPKNPRMRMKLIGTEYINMPNRAPIFALAISHGFFQESSGTVTFNDGMLYDVAIRRKSELNAAIDIPLYALSAVLDIPAAAVNIFNNDLDNRKQLIAVNQQLIHQLEQAEDKALADHAIATAQVGLNQLLVPGDA
ncbi:MAG: hypothetical protein OIF54_03760, partial [Cohaesibacter sp.]|nr:hypothetical protein [Cohaesibacter sp.]